MQDVQAQRPLVRLQPLQHQQLTGDRLAFCMPDSVEELAGSLDDG